MDIEYIPFIVLSIFIIMYGYPYIIIDIDTKNDFFIHTNIKKVSNFYLFIPVSSNVVLIEINE
jgi:hypothetical protein